MTIEEYSALTGITVPASKTVLVTAQLERSQRILESLLGFTLDNTKTSTNQYVESGKTPTDCPCPSDSITLNPPDEVVNSYRLFPYFREDDFLEIDPATAIHKVKLVKDNVTYLTLDTDEYRAEFKNGFTKYLEQIRTWCSATCLCSHVQLAVDADWLWSEDEEIPGELLDILANMTTYYSDYKSGIKSETLGSHSYTKFDNERPEYESQNAAIIKKYAGPNGTINRIITV